MFAQPVTYQSYDNEPVRIASSLSLGRGVCFRLFFSGIGIWGIGHLKNLIFPSSPALGLPEGREIVTLVPLSLKDRRRVWGCLCPTRLFAFCHKVN